MRPDGADKVTGRALYGADMNLPNMIYGKILRSPHAHATIKSIDASKALAMEGVFAVVTGDDFPNLAEGGEIGGEGGGDLSDLAQNIMARGKAMYHGHAIAAVAASSQSIADAALDAIEVKYEQLPVVLDVVKAMEEDAPLVSEHCFTKGLPEKPEKPSNVAGVMTLARGDLDDGFARAGVIIEGGHMFVLQDERAVPDAVEFLLG